MWDHLSLDFEYILDEQQNVYFLLELSVYRVCMVYMESLPNWILLLECANSFNKYQKIIHLATVLTDNELIVEIFIDKISRELRWHLVNPITLISGCISSWDAINLELCLAIA